MFRYQILIEYVGTDFIGWQSQPKGKSVQRTIEISLKKILNENVLVVGQGRLDAGVHAVEQSAHFDLKKKILNIRKFLNRLNFLLNKKFISILNNEKIPIVNITSWNNAIIAPRLNCHSNLIHI